MIEYMAIVTKGFAVVVYLILLTLVIRGKSENNIKIWFFLYLFGLFLWQFSSFVINFVRSERLALFFYNLLAVGITIQSILFFQLSRAFLNIKKQRVWAHISYVSIIFISILPFVKGIYSGLIIGRGGYYIPTFSKYLYLGGSVGYFFWGFGIYNFLNKFLAEKSKIQKNRIKYILFGALIVAIGSLSNFTFLQNYPVDIVCNLVNALLIYYAIHKYHLLELKVVLKKIFQVLIVIFSFIIVFVGSNYFLNRLASSSIEKSVLLTGSLSITIILIILIIFRKGDIGKAIQRFISEEERGFQVILENFSKYISDINSIDELDHILFNTVIDGLDVKSLAFFKYDSYDKVFNLRISHDFDFKINSLSDKDENDIIIRVLMRERGTILRDELGVIPKYREFSNALEKFFKKYNSEAIMPVFVKNELYGFLLLGEKRNRQVFSSHDLRFLSTLSYSAETGLSNLFSYQELRNRLSEQMLLFVISENFRNAGRLDKLVEKTAELVVDFMRIKWVSIVLNLRILKDYVIKGKFNLKDLDLVKNVVKSNGVIRYFRKLVEKNHTYLIFSDEIGKIELFNLYDESYLKRCLFLPLMQDDDVFGVLILNFTDENRLNYMIREKQNLLRSLQTIISQGIMLHHTIYQLKSAKARADNILEGVGKAGNIIFIVDKNGKIIAMNSASSKLLGYTYDELIDKDINDIIYKEEANSVNSIFNFEKERLLVNSFEVELIKKNGGILPALVSLFPIDDDEYSEENHHIFIARDISALKHAQKSVKKSEERYRKLFNEIKEFIITWNSNGIVTDVNLTGVRKLGHASPKEIIGKKVGEVLGLTDREIKELEQGILNFGEVKNKKIQIKLNNSQLTFLADFSAIYDDDWMIEEFKGVLHDITELKMLERQLFQAQKLESIGTLAGGIAHDFNNIITAILGYASVMKSKLNKDEPFYQYLDIIETSAERAANLTSKLLTFSRSEKTEEKLVDINKVVKDTVVLLKETIGKKVDMRVNLSPQKLIVKGDESQIHQIVMNLCVNARDAMPEGGILTISTWMKELSSLVKNGTLNFESKGYAVISVEDTGIGMDDTILKRIYDPFFTTKDKDKGTGLGLSVVYGIVRNHNGIIEVQSEPNVGTRFDIYLPLVKGYIKEEVHQQKEFIEGFGETILIIDDEEHVRGLLKDVFESKGYNTLVAADGMEGVELYKKNYTTISLVLIDMVMPKMDGIETYREMKNINKNLKAIVATGFSSESKIKEIQECGIKYFIKKPFDIEELLSLVRNVIDS